MVRTLLGIAMGMLVATVPLVAVADCRDVVVTVSSRDGMLRVVDLADGTTLSAEAMTLVGDTVFGANGLAMHPETGDVYVLLQTELADGRILATLDLDTAEATEIADLLDTFAGIAFDADGVLYGVTGDGGDTPENLYEIDITDGTLTDLCALGNGEDGETIGFNADDGLLYHASGLGVGSQIFESIDDTVVSPCAITDVDIVGTDLADSETLALVWWEAEDKFLWSQGYADPGSLANFPILYATAVPFDADELVEIGTLDHVMKGMVIQRIAVDGATLAADDSEETFFGHAVDSDDGVVVIGAFSDDEEADNAGAAYVYRLEGGVWVEEQKLTASDPTTGDLFGVAVAISGDAIAVGSRRDDDLATNSGAVYVFRHDGTEWVEEQKLTTSDGLSGDELGSSVSIDGDVVVAGAPRDDDPVEGSNMGAVYIFSYDGDEWAEDQKLTADDGTTLDEFGSSVSLDGSVTVVGTRRDDLVDENEGSVYVFRLDAGTWEQDQKITASDGADGDEFGQSVGLDGDTLVVGAHLTDDVAVNSGSIYIYTDDGGTFGDEVELSAADAALGDQFGFSVDVRGDAIAVGASEVGEAAGAGTVFEFDGTTWNETKTVSGEEDEELGFSASIDGLYAAFGAPNEPGSGKVVVVSRGACDFNACDIADGDVDDLNDNGIPDVCEDIIEGALFKRGDADGNGTFFALLDALYMLAFAFTGGPEPPCFDAADADGNNAFFALLDALYALAFAFTGGTSLPIQDRMNAASTPRETTTT